MASARIFVACGTRDVETAGDLATRLGDELPDASVDVWNKPGVFELSDSLFNQLLDTADAVDFAIVLLSSDDGVVADDRAAGGGAAASGVQGDGGATNDGPTVSPNVMFELGLFYGRLERYRTIIISRGQRMPDDGHFGG